MFIKNITKVRNNRNRGLIETAYYFGEERHEGQKRKFSNDPYFIHPIRVAQLLGEFNDEVIIAGLLHDILEDTDTSSQELVKKFGKRVTLLVNGCTKDPSTQDRLVILKKTAINDKWVIYIKLADRYDNLQDNITNMKTKTIRRYLKETPLLLEFATEKEIDFLGKEIQSKLEEIRKWFETNL